MTLLDWGSKLHFMFFQGPRVAPPGSQARLDALLRPLVGVPRDYRALGRSVPAGKNTTMLLRHAAAAAVDPSPAAHYVWTVFKAEGSVYQTDELLKTL